MASNRNYTIEELIEKTRNYINGGRNMRENVDMISPVSRTIQKYLFVRRVE